MKPRFLLLVLLAFAPTYLTAQQQNPDPDSKQDDLAVCARLKLMNQSEFQVLMAKAQSGDAAAQYQVGKAYDVGKHVPKNSNEAAKWWLKAAEHGDANTQFWLGVAYEDDWFGTTDSELALKWYQKAADAGDPDAQMELGQKYADGDGVKQSYELAAKWFRKAAEHVPDLGGAGQGRSRLGQLYMEGLGVPRDYVQAYIWLSLYGPDAAVDAKEHLSAAQVQEADRLIKSFCLDAASS